MATDRERFLAALYTGPLLRGDCIVVLAGEDGEARAQTAAELFRQGAAPGLFVTGGLHTPPRRTGAEALAGVLLGAGIAPDRIITDTTAMHTGDQAKAAIDLAMDRGWKQLLLVASPYHLPRAFLTFVYRLHVAMQHDTIRIVPVPASNVRWFEAPEGLETERWELLDIELDKCHAYVNDVATFAAGLDYLRAWEAR